MTAGLTQMVNLKFMKIMTFVHRAIFHDFQNVHVGKSCGHFNDTSVYYPPVVYLSVDSPKTTAGLTQKARLKIMKNQYIHIFF